MCQVFTFLAWPASDEGTSANTGGLDERQDVVAGRGRCRDCRGLRQPGGGSAPADPADPGGWLDASGPWEISGEWSLALNTASGKVEFQAALNMVRAENAARQSHTHHIAMNDGSVTPITGGFRISGSAPGAGHFGDQPIDGVVSLR